eukprot:CAMPEP_0202428666 /NCGR_PEP_ID=MMETSP1345-20130828/2614_1 /ASSEMBLY_ACC=CAM_ASM_000843 /TAXON_ID=342563 /ORGANISM="Fabrea Fabrea salina" /LENGTH=694 /DNA_ID=CAMNT_0049039703 /DNA_START=994 /DNA_END=3078 /DNA_ORIENTATION=-
MRRVLRAIISRSFAMERVTLSNRQEVEKVLNELSIPFNTREHREILTVAEGLEVCEGMQGAFVKNLFLKDKKGKFYLLTALHDTPTSFKALQKMLKGTGGGVRAAPEESLSELLGVVRGAVNPFALVNDSQKAVQFLVDKNLIETEKILVHPMENTSTTEITTEGLKKFLEHFGREMNVLDFNEEEKKEQPKKEEEDKKKETKLGLSVKKTENFSQWYTEVITKGEMIEYYDVSGCYVLRPWAYSIWEFIQSKFDKDIKGIGVKNSYFPMFVSKHALQTEENHVEGFAPEVAWVTKSGDSDLAEPIAIRPTSETIMYPAFAKWIRSHRDLPLKLNQWCNVVRWEFKHPTPFIRTREFLWQEGHTAHATYKSSEQEVYQVLDFYREVYEELLAVPVIKGIKSELEKFAGGDFTTTVETMIPVNGRGIQGGTSHCLGQNFSKMFEIAFEDENRKRQLVWQNSWGLTTRTIGVMIMVHGDDSGLVLPPRVAPTQVVVIPVVEKKQVQTVVEKAQEVYQQLCSMGIRAELDDRSNYNPGWKYYHWELKGVPLRVEIGPRDVKNSTMRLVRRDTKEPKIVSTEEVSTIPEFLETIQKEMLARAKSTLDSRIVEANNWEGFLEGVNDKNFVLTPWCEQTECETRVKERSGEESKDTEGEHLTGSAKTLCMPLDQGSLGPESVCFHCGAPASKKVLWGRSY